MPIFSNPGRMRAFIMVPFSENEVSNIKLCILIKSWTYRAWAAKLDFQLPWAWWEASGQRCHFPLLSFSQSLRSENLLSSELKRQPGEKNIWTIYQKHNDRSKAIRNPGLHSFCHDPLHWFPQVDHLLQVSGDRQNLPGAGGWGLPALPCLLESLCCQMGKAQAVSELNPLPEPARCSSGRTSPASTAGLLARASAAGLHG